MKELYSNADDCLKLARFLKSELNEKIEFCGSTYLEVVSGKYHSLPSHQYENFIDYRNDAVEFSYKFLENGFLSMQVNDLAYKKASMGHKLAVLSEICAVISKLYGMPTLFYTIKDDDENSINLEWDFIEKEEAINDFKNGCMFDDAEVDKLIIIDDEKEKTNVCSLNKRTKEIISKTVGLPFEMLYLVDENIDDFVLYKKDRVIGYKEDVALESKAEKIKIK